MIEDAKGAEEWNGIRIRSPSRIDLLLNERVKAERQREMKSRFRVMMKKMVSLTCRSGN